MSIVYISLSDKLLDFLRSTVPDAAHDAESSGCVDMDVVFAAVEKAKDAPSLSTLLEGTEVVRREKKVEDLSQYSEMEILRFKAAEKAYQRSVASVKPWERDTSVHGEMRDVSNTVAFAMQFVLAFIGAFALGYYFVETFVMDDIAMKVVAGGVCAFSTLMLESVLFIIRDNKNTDLQKRTGHEPLTQTKKATNLAEKKEK